MEEESSGSGDNQNFNDPVMQQLLKSPQPPP
jgi:hypothetical protein